jgi:hypothetical protein
MDIRTTKHLPTEKGNAVALTLLGLAVALLAGMVVLYIVGSEKPQPVPIEIATSGQEDPSDEADPYALWNTYTNVPYAFTIRYPKGWVVAEQAEISPYVVLYDASQTTAIDTGSALDYQTRVSIFPLGEMATSTTYDEVPSKTIIAIRGASALDRVLEGTKQPWSTTVRFDQVPKSWNVRGQISARVFIESEEVTYERNGQKIETEMFDPSLGDVLRRYGYVNPDSWQTITLILQSFSFISPNADAPESITKTAESKIRTDFSIKNLEPDTLITTPLILDGSLTESWGAPEKINITLTDTSGAVLASTSVNVLLDTTAPSLFRFSAVLDFAQTTNATGTLLIVHPDGITNQAEIPVRFRDF